MKKVIIYASIHHGNTFKLVKEISKECDVELIDATQIKQIDLSQYDLIGFASGIDFGKFYDCIEKFMIQNLPEYKQVFFLYTCANVKNTFTKSVKSIASYKKAIVLGEYGCKGYNNYGPLKLIGGMNKINPSQEEIACAIKFVRSLWEEYK